MNGKISLNLHVNCFFSSVFPSCYYLGCCWMFIVDAYIIHYNIGLNKWRQQKNIIVSAYHFIVWSVHTNAKLDIFIIKASNMMKISWIVGGPCTFIENLTINEITRNASHFAHKFYWFLHILPYFSYLVSQHSLSVPCSTFPVLCSVFTVSMHFPCKFSRANQILFVTMLSQ